MLIKILFTVALIAGYAYVSNQDFEDQQLVNQWNQKQQLAH